METLSVLFLTVALAAGAEDAKPQAGPVQRIFQLKYADANRVANLLRPLGISVTAEGQSGVLAVSGSPQTIAAVEEALKKLDVPPAPAKDVELIGYVLLGSPQGSAAPDVQDLAGVIAQLRSLSPYKSFKLLESFVLRDRDGQQGRVRGFMTGLGATDSPTSYDFQFRRISVAAPEGAHVIRVDGLELFVTRSGRGSSTTLASIHTDIDIREGQKVVVGKANMNGSEDALFLVLSAKVVE